MSEGVEPLECHTLLVTVQTGTKWLENCLAVSSIKAECVHMLCPAILPSGSHTHQKYIYKHQSQAQLTSTTVLALLAMLIRNMPKLEINFLLLLSVSSSLSSSFIALTTTYMILFACVIWAGSLSGWNLSFTKVQTVCRVPHNHSEQPVPFAQEHPSSKT